MAAISLIATITDIGRNFIANMLITGRGYQISQFVIGNGGHDPVDPITPLTPDPTVTALPGQSYGPSYLEELDPPFYGILPAPFNPQFQALLDYTDANGEISNVGLIGEIISSPSSFTTTGTTTTSSDTITGIPNAGDILVNSPITGLGIPLGTTVISILGPNSIQISNEATASGTVPLAVVDPLMNTKFLFAHGNRPLLIKTDGDQFTITITLQT